ncbi:MAG: TonB-dependent receptor, partial [Ginsengibacter sp.]
ASSYVAQNSSNAGKTNASRVLESDLQSVSSILKTRFGYETGPYQGYTLNQTNYKWIAKIDWNISQIHKLSFTYNGLDASKDKPAHPSAIQRRGPDFTTLQFRNSGYEITNKLHSFGTEFKSNFGNNYANKLRVVYSIFRDNRNPFSTPFPALTISKNGVAYIIAGHEPFSIHNVLDQDAFQVTDNFNIFFKNHSLTVGGSFESFKFANSFNLVAYGLSTFDAPDIQKFKDSVPVGGGYIFDFPQFGSPGYPLEVDVNKARTRDAADVWTLAKLTVGQISGYIQDEWAITKDFRLTYGLRMDIPQYFNASYRDPNTDFGTGTFQGSYTEGSPTLQNNDNLTLYDAAGNPVTNGAGKDLDNHRFPTRKPLLSPRLGFNYDVKGDKTIQLRGGSGLFTGRFPFVWLGNQIANPTSGFYNATDKNFRWPQIWRSNLGLDVRIPFGTIFSADAAYTKDVKGMMVRNYKLGSPTGTLNDATGDNRKVYLPADQGAANAYVFTNTNVGHQFNFSFQAQQSFRNGYYLMAAYNYLVSEDASSISAEISSDAFDRNPILNNANGAISSTSLYGNTHRIIVAGIRKFEYGKGKYATTFSTFHSWSSGNRFAYVYGGDINNDGTASNDLLYVPIDAEIGAMAFNPDYRDALGNIQSPAAQQQAYKAFISQDEYLSSRRGKYTEKYEGETPWFNQLDVRILQDFNFNVDKKINTIQVSLDFVNFGNLLNSNWGIRKYATTSGYFQPISVAYNNNNPVYTFDPSLTSTFTTSPDLPSRWQMQLGLRYIF